MANLTNAAKVADWLAVSRGWRISAFIAEDTLSVAPEVMTKGSAINRNIDLIRETVQKRKDALRVLGKY